MNLTLQSAPSVDAVSLADAKAHLNVDFSGDDALIQAYLDAAIGYLDGRDGVLGRALITQTWDQTIDDFPHGDNLPLGLAPVQSITSVTYRDIDGNTQTFAAESYMLRHRYGRTWIHLKDDYTWPETDDEPDAVTVRFVTGYGDVASDVPAPLVSAIKLHVGHLYDLREPVNVGSIVSEIPFGYDALIAPYRVRAV
jgi:uncharacterized phiE125 gp8 family phage protein